jgi:long-chain acyl-CoA synthetase
LPSDIIQKFKQLYGIDIIDFWGLTEATCHVTCPPLDDNVLPGSVGRALPGWEMRIIDDNGIELPVNQKGEVIVRGPIMAGYYKNPEDTAEAIRDGWLYTGDYGKLDDKGNLFLLGRKKEMIIVKGQNIYPSDIEKVLCSHPQIAEAAVVGIPDMLRGERVGAVISLKAGESVVEQEIMQFCRKYLSDYKVPKQIAFMDALPKTATGKIIKQELTLFPV